MLVEIVVPNLGLETGQPLLLSAWFAEPGEEVFEEDRLVELLMDGATFDVPSPASGTLTEIMAYPDDPLQAGQVLGMIESPDPIDETPPDAPPHAITGD